MGKWFNFLIGALVLVFNFGCINSKDSVNPPKNATTINWNKEANISTNALITHFWNKKSNYWNTSIKSKNLAYWTGAHATDVIIAAYNRTGKQRFKEIVNAWYKGVLQQMGTFVNAYYDDMEWNALALVRAYKSTHQEKFKHRAINLWINIKKGWSDIGGGGIIWTKSNPRGKNAISNAPASILASMLYNLTGEKKYLGWAKKIYAWQKNHLVNQKTGAVWDHLTVHPDGSITVDKDKDWVFTYNQGVYLEAGLKLYNITGKQVYLDDAVQAANYALDNLVNESDNLLKDNGDGDGGLFNGIFVRHLAQLILEKDLNETIRKRYIRFLEHNAKTLLTEGRSFNNLYSSYWGDKPAPSADVDQSTETSGCILIETMALLANKGILNG